MLNTWNNFKIKKINKFNKNSDKPNFNLHSELIIKTALYYFKEYEFFCDKLQDIIPFIDKEIELLNKLNGIDYYDNMINDLIVYCPCVLSYVKHIISGDFFNTYEFNENNYTEIRINEYKKMPLDMNKHYEYFNKFYIKINNIIKIYKSLLKEAINKYYEFNCISNIRWINERNLFLQIQKYFKDYYIVYQYRPSWLGYQSFDIYFIDLNIAIEYQGKQHYEQVKFFQKTEDDFKKTQMLDGKKRKLCEENDCALIYVKYDYKDINDVFIDIEKTIKLKKNKT